MKRNGADDLIQFLEQMTSFFQPPMCPIERLVLHHGTDFKPAKRPRGMRKQQDRQCFRNATNLSNARDDLEYAEGYAIHMGGIPCIHAWCVNAAGEVVDPTWPHPERSRYRGVIIPRKVLWESVLRNKVFGVLDCGVINSRAIDQIIAIVERVTPPQAMSAARGKQGDAEV